MRLKAKLSSENAGEKQTPSSFISKEEQHFFGNIQNTQKPFFESTTVQPKLEIGKPNDKYEQEADRVADAVMRMPASPLQMQSLDEEEEEEKLQMQPLEEEELQMMPEMPKTQQMCPRCRERAIQGKPLDCPACEKKLQMMPVIQKKNVNQSYASPEITDQLNASKGTGNPLPPALQKKMSHKMGADFGEVRTHTDARAIQMNQQLGAKAFTFGNHIYFNRGNFSPSSSQGKHLLAHELTHTIQQGYGEPLIQKQGEEGTEESSGGRNHLARLVGDLVRDQLSDSGLRGHLRSLGTALRDMAVEGTAESTDRPSGAAERLTALNIPQAFETTSRAIIRDPELRHIRRRIVEVVGINEVTALITAMAAGLAAFLADANLRGEPSTDLGGGFTLGGMFDMGSAQDIQFNQIQTYVQYANDHFRAQVTGGVQNVEADEETGEEEHLVGTGTGEIRVGTDLSHLMSRVSINSDGELTLTGRLSAGTQFGSNERLVFTADVSHMFATGETVFRPGVSGRFNLGSGQRLEIGSQLQVSSEEGLNRLTGFIEYKRDQLFLRIEGNVQGIPGSESISPGNEMLIQGRVIIPLF